MAEGQKIARNAAYLVAATTLNKALAFITFTLVARLTGPSVTGTYFFGVSVTSVFVTIADLGLTPVVIRAIAASNERSQRMLGAALRLKLFLAPTAILLALGYGVWRHVDPTTMATIAVACLVMTADTVSLLLYGSIRGKLQLKPEAIGMLIGQVLTSVTAATVAWAGLGSVGLAAALLVGSLWNVLWSLMQTRRMQIQAAIPTWEDLQYILREAMPFAIAGIAVKFYSYIDSLLIQANQGEKAVGYYSVAYKLTYALQFLPLTFTAALYPALAAAWAKQEHDKVKIVFLGSLRLMAAISFPLAAGLSALADPIVRRVYGSQYLATIPVLQILPWVLIPIFLDFPVGSLLNSSHRAHIKTSAMVATMFINALLNAVLVPQMGPVGAAWAGIFSFWALYLIGASFSAKDAGGWKVQVSLLARTSGAAAVTWFAWARIGSNFPLIADAIFGAAIAVLAAFLFGLVTVADIQRIKSWRKTDVPESIHA